MDQTSADLIRKMNRAAVRFTTAHIGKSPIAAQGFPGDDCISNDQTGDVTLGVHFTRELSAAPNT